MNQAEKNNAIDLAIKAIEKKYGKGSVFSMDSNTDVRYDSSSSGSLAIDEVVGNGGYPKGRILEIYGPPSNGKTTITLHAIAEVQRRGGKAAFVDSEHALDTAYAKALGVNVSELLIAQPDHGEQALDITEMLVRSGAVDMVVVDSVAALVPKAELEGEMESNQPGQQARLMSKGLRKLAGAVYHSKTILIFTNQTRFKVGGYGNPETTAGGEALKFYASIRLEVRRTENLKSGTEIVAQKVRVKAVKNKCFPPFRENEIEIEFGVGISKAGEILDYGVDLGLIEKAGAWFKYKGEPLGQGREKAKAELNSNKELFDELYGKIVGMMMPDFDNEPLEGEVLNEVGEES